MSPADVVGTVARLQVQRSRLKPGERGQRVYDPAPLLEVAELEVSRSGVVGLAPEGRLVDVHHADHPDSRNVRLVNGLSVLPRAHYDQLRERFGPQVCDGLAGETLLLDTAGPLAEGDLAGRLLLDTEDGEPLELRGATAAPPCVEFTRFLLGAGPAAPVDDAVRDALAFLGDGRRGFYLQVTGTGRVARGARLVRA